MQPSTAINQCLCDVITKALKLSHRTILNRNRTNKTATEGDLLFGCDARLSVEPVGFCALGSKFIVVKLLWLGTTFKCINLSIDIVPALVMPDKCERSDHELISQQNYSSHLIVAKDNILLRADCSQLEHDIIKQLPVKVRQGYVLAKQVRLSVVIMQQPGAQQEFPFTDDFTHLMKTYYLKHALMNIVRKVPAGDDCSGSELDWGIRIFKQLRDWLLNDKRIPNVLRNRQNFDDCECVFRYDSESKHQQQYANLLNSIQPCIEFLQAQQQVQLRPYWYTHEKQSWIKMVLDGVKPS